MSQYNVQLYPPVTVDIADWGNEHGTICKKSKFGKAIADCNKPGDCEDACRFLLREFKIEFTIMRPRSGRYGWVPATHADKVMFCQRIYDQSERDWAESEEWCDIYLVWHACMHPVE